ncbi:MAG: FAD-binding protein [Candidatus Zixiibacteriota bacterium]|nr:MAG: FAD-binding protein [candidate division Zixibacteria bacterium]
MPEIPYKLLSKQLSRPDLLVTELEGLEDYFHDATEDKGTPQAVVFAEDESDVVTTARFCQQNHLPLIPRGAGTGLSGGCVPTLGGIVLSVERMKKLEIDSRNRIAYVGPGVITKELQDEAEKLGVTYPPDPASYDESTLAGNVAENAGGLRCRRFGVTRDYVIGLRSVTMSGEIIETGVFSANACFGLGDLLVGSEGTLAVVTEIAVRLVPIPKVGDTILVAFDNPKDAAQTVSDITRAGIIPTVLEYLDGDAADCSNKYERTEGLDSVAAIVLIETPFEDRQECAGKIERFCQANHCSYFRIESEPEKVEKLWKVRRNLSKAVKEMGKVRVSEDVAVPNSKFPILVEFVLKLNASSPLRINAFGHAGDGNLHVNFLSMSGAPEELALMEGAIEQLLKKALDLGGTLSGEHGIGLAKRRYLRLEFDGATIDYMKRVKSVFDPENLLNPGKIF